MFREDTSGQAHTLEAIAAGALVIATIIFAVQATAITPLTVSTSHQHIETQEKKMADGVLEHVKTIEVSGGVTAIEHAVLYWDTGEQSFYNATPNGYLGHYPDTVFGDAFDETFTDERIATNIYVTYSNGDGTSSTEQMVHMGDPSDNAMSATTTVVLYDDHKFTAPGESGAISDTPEFYMQDVFASSNVYNVAEVRVVVWRI